MQNIDMPRSESSTEDEQSSPIEHKKKESTERQAAKPRNRKREKEEAESKKNDERVANRLLKSPDIKEAIEKLSPQMQAVKKYFDGTLHRERVKQDKDQVIMVSELQSVLDTLNQEIQKHKEDGLQFRAVDAWGAIVGMLSNPEQITLRFYPQAENYEEYQKKHDEGALWSAQSMCLQIDKDSFSIIDYKGKEIPPTPNVDSFMFALQYEGEIKEDSVASFYSETFDIGVAKGNLESFYKKTIVERFKQYGLPVYTSEANQSYGYYEIYVDLTDTGWIKAREKQYLFINVFRFEKNDTILVGNKSPKAERR